MPRQHSMLTQELTDRELVESAIQVLPNLRAVSAADECFGPHWKAKTSSPNVQMYEFDAFASGLGARPRALSSASASASTRRFWPWPRLPAARPRASVAHFDRSSPVTASARATSAWPSVTAGVPYAGVTFCDLNCHWTEALELLFSSDPAQFSASARAIWGAKLRRCDQLRAEPFQREARALSPADWARRGGPDAPAASSAPRGRIAVNTYELAPRKRDLPLGKHARAQQLCFATYTQQSAARNEAVVVMKTLRKDVHERLVDASERSALRGAIDHLAVGYHLAGRYSDLTGHHTRLVMCAYVSTFAGNEVPEVMHWRVGLRDAGDRANSDAKHVVALLARAACHFAAVVQRRRFGLQPFLYAAPAALRGHCDHDDDRADASCAVCERDFGLLRRTQVCELCGHHVCRRCSRKYEVEPRAGGVRKSRVCFTCASRVESSVALTQREALSAKKSTVSTWYETIEDGDDDDDNCDDRYQYQYRYQPLPHHGVLAHPGDGDGFESLKPGHQLADALASPHPLDRARGIEVLKVAVRQVTQEPPRGGPKPLDPAVIDKYLEVRQRLTRMSSRELLCDANSYATTADESGSRGFPVFYQQPLAGSDQSSVRSDTSSRRFFQYLSSSPRAPPTRVVFDASDSDTAGAIGTERDGLDAICEVAAQRLACPMAFVSVLGRDEQHIVGAYQAPGCLYRLPRNQSVRAYNLLADGRPVVVRHPLQDARLRRMPIIRDAGVRFLASFPVIDRHGAVVAAISAIDTLPRGELSHDEHLSMAALAKLAADALNDDQPASPGPFTPRARY
ncbi:hypothetical protein PybrP1_001061 [[Pythium] brassicae (nom. inval.)]|nr:hypothetical protein PybrP1_001061 [[Pythium] brassicae (nom. inval.)]